MKKKSFLVGLVALIMFSTNLYAQQPKQDNTTQQAKPSHASKNLSRNESAPVVFMADTLFYLHDTIGSFTPGTRAQIIEGRLANISKSVSKLGDSLYVNHRETTSDIMYGDVIIMSVTDGDAAPLHITRDAAAQLFLSKINNSLNEEIKFNSVKEIAENIGLLLAALAGLYVFFLLLTRLFRWLIPKAETLDHNILFKDNQILQFFKVLTPRRERDLILLSMRILRLGIIALFLIFYLPFMFSFLPWTRNIAQTIFSYLLKPVSFAWNGLTGFLPNLFFIIVILLITHYFIKVLRYFTSELERETIRVQGFYGDWARPTFKIVRVIVYLFAFIIIFPYLPGSSSPAFQGISIFLGLLLSLGSTTAVANIVAGIIITYMRPFQIGDRVKIAETIGDVTERTLLVTRVITIKNENVTIPNAQILGTHLWNFSRHAADMGIILHTSVTIGYNVPSQKVRELLIKAAKQTSLIEKNPEPFVFQTSLGDFYVTYEINGYTKEPNKMASIYSEMHDHILTNFNEAGVEILSPHYNAVRDGNNLDIPPENIPKDYKKTGFLIENPLERIINPDKK